MIIVKLMGGIGNQMFEYAAARRLAHVHNATLKIDLGWFENCQAASPRPYELHVFDITESFASKEEISGLVPAAGSKWRRLVPRFSPARRPGMFVVEKHFHFDPEILKLPNNVHLDGYWQSEKYFRDVTDTIREEFKVKAAPDENNRRMADMIKDSQAVSLHVRRGDYVTNPATGEYHGTCPLDYYQTAIEMVASKAKNPHFFVFSDDPAWVKENVKSQHPMTFVDFNGPDKAYEDMRLMSLCRHHIIANSSFSWWGAWLSKNPGKIVIAPSRWFNSQEIDTKDLIPKEWLRI